MSAELAMQALRHLESEGALRPVDSAFATLLRERLGADPAVALAGALAMRAVALGHSGFALTEAAALLVALEAAVELPPHEEWAAALRASPWVAPDVRQTGRTPGRSAPLLAFEHGRVSLYRYARYEQVLAERLLARVRAPGWSHADSEAVGLKPVDLGPAAPKPAAPKPADDDDAVIARAVARLFGEEARTNAAQPSRIVTAPDRQALAAVMALRRRLLLITGGPGTGKTTTVARLLALRIACARLRGEAPPRIALAAPTGRAAVRLGEAIDQQLRRDLDANRIDAAVADAVPRQARTLHRLLGWQPGTVAFRHHAGRPLPFDLVVVDEASMVDLPLMTKLLDAVPTTATLVLLGDPDQLPAVEAGDVLGALCAAAGEGATLPAVDAEIVGRWLGAAPLAHEDSEHPLAGARVHLHRVWRQAEAETLQALAAAVRDGDRETVRLRLRGDDPALQWRHGDAAVLADTVREHVLPQLRAVRDAADPEAALREAARLRLLTALRRGPFGAEHWNAQCAAELGARETFFHGRLIAIAANSPRHGLYNGDLGVVWRDPDSGEVAAWFRTAAGLHAWRSGQLPMHTTAFATTVHKAQGSEFDRVMLILPQSDVRVLSRELLYTALTRARHRVLLWAPPEVLETTLARRTWRDSGLETRLRGLDKP